MAKVLTLSGRVLLPMALGLSLAGCVVAEPAPPTYAYNPGYGYYAPAYPYYGGTSFGFSLNSGGGWEHRHWHGRDWR